MRFQSIRWRLVLSYVMLTVLTVFLVGILSLTLLQQYIRLQTRERLAENGRAIAQQAYSLMQPFPRLDRLQELAQSMSFLGNMRVRILDARFNVVIDSGMSGESTSVMWVQDVSPGGEEAVFLVPLFPWKQREPITGQDGPQQDVPRLPGVVIRVDEGPWGRNVMFEPVSPDEPFSPSEPIINPFQPSSDERRATVQTAAQVSVPAVHLPIGDPASPLGFVQVDSLSAAGEQVMATMQRTLLLAGLVATVIAVIAGLLVSRSLTAPIQALAESATRMSSGDLSARAPENAGTGEIGQLARQFNTMAGRLQSSFAALSAERDALRRFIADASHELRTPITALGNFVELLQGPAAEDSAAREEFLTESQAQVRRMEWITANLLDLSRLDAGLVHLDCQTHDLGELLHASAAPFLVRAREQDIRLEVQPPDQPVTVHGDRARIEMAIGNLLDNALKFTPPGGWVTLRGEAIEGETSVRIQVQDSGPGIAAEDLPHVFERFYRGRTSQHGSGLGLAIVQSIAQAHSGQVLVESQPGEGSTFSLVI